ncbi:hypothetical protein [Rossellomorea marisflavi]|uniref:hypothetical protein n=1 Tax=Rossellomorea marisflavi TaxID=189381 RepID=UPI00345CF4B2
MEFNMVKDLSFHFKLDEEELIALYSLVRKMRNITGHEVVGYKVQEFEISESELSLIDWLDKYITHSDASEELKLEVE